MADLPVSITLSAHDDASAAIARVRDTMGEVGEAAKGAGEKANETASAFERIKAGFETGLGIGLGIAGFHELRDVLDATVETVVGFNAELETMGMRLENLTGSVGATTEALQAVREQAEASPFEFKDIEAGEERLLRFNFSIEDSTKLLKVAADAAAGGAGSVDLITEAFGRMNTKEELTSRGLMSLTAAGIPVFDMLAQGLGVSTAQAEDLVKKGLIPAKEGIDILSAAIEAKFPDMAAKVATGFDSTVKNLKETVAFAAAEMGKPLFDVLESAIRDALAFLKSPDVKGALDDFSQNVASTVRDVVEWFKQLGSAMSQPEVQTNLHEAWNNIRVIGGELWGLVRDFFIPQQHAINDALGGGGVDSANSFSGQIKALSGELRDFTGQLKDVAQFANDLGDKLNVVKDAGDHVATMLHNALIVGLEAVLSPLRKIIDDLNELEAIADKVFRIRIEIPGQAGLQQFLDSIHTVQTVSSSSGSGASDGGATGAFGGSAAALRPSQFNDPALSADEAAAACGPAAAVAFAKANGMYPTLRQAQDIAEKIGWTAGGGMNGIANEQTLLANMGMSSTLNLSPTESQMQIAAHSPAGEIISTPGHFFTATGFNSATGQYNVGSSGTDLKNGGAPEMTLAQMQAMEGQVNGILTDIHKATTDMVSVGGAVSAAKSNGMDAFKQSFQPYADYAAQQLRISPSDVTAMAISESGGGNVPGNSFFGMKASQADVAAGNFTHQSTWENVNGQRVDQGANFKTYDTPQAALDDWIAYIKKNDPEAVGANTPEQFAAGLKKGGYMTDSAANYGASLRALGATNTPYQGANSFVGPDGTVNMTEAAATNVSTADMAAKLAEPMTDTFAKLMRDSATKLTGIQTTEDRSLASAATQFAPGGTADQAAERDAAKKSATLDANKAIAEDATRRKAAVAQEVADDTERENQRLASEAVVYNRGLQDQATAHSRALEDDQVLVDQQIAHVELVHQRDLQDAQTVHQQTLALAATKHQQDLQDAQTLVNQQIANVQLLHQRQLQDAQVPLDEQLQAQATVHSRTLEDAEVQYQYQRSLGKATTDAQRAQIKTAHDDELENIAHQRQLQDAEIVYQEGLQATARKVQRDAQDAEIRYQDDQKAQQAAAQRVVAAAESQYQMGLAAEETKYQRGLQDTEVVYQQGVAAQARARSRALADEETAYNRGLEDKAAAHTAELAATARAFAASEKAKMDAVDKQLADEAFARQKQQVIDELAAKKASIAEEYALKVAAAIETARIARETLKTSTDQSAQDQIEAAVKALAGFNGAGQPIIDKMKADWAAFDGDLATASTDVVGNQTKIQTAQAATAASAAAATTAITTATAGASAAYALSAVDISKSLGITDIAVETYANSTSQDWDTARGALNDLVTAYGVGSQMISAALGITDKDVERYANDHHTNWEKARVDLNTAAIHAGEVLGTGGTIPKAVGFTSAAFDTMQAAAAKTSPLDQLKTAAQELAKQGLDPATKAAQDLQRAIQEIQDKTITVTTQFVNNGANNGTAGGNIASSGGLGGIGSSSSNNLGGSSGGGSSSSDGSGLPSGNSPADQAARQVFRDNNPGLIVGRDDSGNISISHRAAGGPVVSGQAYLVGEHGPELFTPGASGGNITPNGAGGIDYDKLAEAMVRAMNKNGAFAVGVDQVHSALLQKGRRSGPLQLT